MAKEKNYNPVQAEKKAEKQKQLRKQKANVQAQRTEKLARRNPGRIQRDIESLKELDQNGSMRPHDKQRLAELEKDLAAVNKARAALGDKAPQFKPEWRDDGGDRGGRGDSRGRGRGRGGGGVLGKRTRDGDWAGRNRDDSSDSDADVKDIPMPRDIPPPIPRRYQQGPHADDALPEPKKPTIVYEAAPQLRDLLKEATRFMPTAVAQKMKLAKGEGRLLEPEEFDKLQTEGYMKTGKTAKPVDPEIDEELEAFWREQQDDNTTAAAMENAAEAAVQEAEHAMIAAEAQGQIIDPASEGRVAENKLRHVEMEEVEDEDL
ncbi:WW domain binding protein 11-domain-containing protein [Massariosphaeria phaeospora]|uniref:WW domain binding protein 11-domain-containing protein n=1 Tax=Massariosphaeria phaeospora TaxID=100035 RepID=A0A7C8M9V1_9PLEO|nr:WW domain binding protein 11-domain-containing protein [Massariosphaeria phaeospora]